MKTTMMRVLGIAAATAMLLAAPGDVEAQSSEQMARVAKGATVYGQNCTRCHNARSPGERTDREWVTIVAHMRARANLTRTQARMVATFLKSTNTPEFDPSRQAPAGERPVTGGDDPDSGKAPTDEDSGAPDASPPEADRAASVSFGSWGDLTPDETRMIFRYLLRLGGG